MQKLVEGVHRFQEHIFRSDREFFERLAHGQKPETLFITCSDSRINPNLLTQTDPGELFILRNAGNLVPPAGATNGGEGATIEYAVTLLQVRDIIICGHSHCGAMQGLLTPEVLEPLPAVSAWMSNAESTRVLMKEKYSHLSGTPLLMATTQENVLAQLENLRTHPAVAERLQRGDLHLHGWVYKLETGEVFSYDPSVGQFVPVASVAVDEAESVAEGI